MKRRIYALAIVMMLVLAQVLSVSAAESARAEMTVTGAPAGVNAVAIRSEGWVCDSAGTLMVSEVGANCVLLNSLQITTTAAPGAPGDYTFACAAVRAGMNMKAYGMNNFTGMWEEVPATAGAGSVTVTMDAATLSDVALIVVK